MIIISAIAILYCVVFSLYHAWNYHCLSRQDFHRMLDIGPMQFNETLIQKRFDTIAAIGYMALAIIIFLNLIA